jgi:hypothetical protein
MYESALTEAAALGHAGGGGSPGSSSPDITRGSGSGSPRNSNLSTKEGAERGSVLGELGDFF